MKLRIGKILFFLLCDSGDYCEYPWNLMEMSPFFFCIKVEVSFTQPKNKWCGPSQAKSYQKCWGSLQTEGFACLKKTLLSLRTGTCFSSLLFFVDLFIHRVDSGFCWCSAEMGPTREGVVATPVMNLKEAWGPVCIFQKNSPFITHSIWNPGRPNSVNHCFGLQNTSWHVHWLAWDLSSHLKSPTSCHWTGRRNEGRKGVWSPNSHSNLSGIDGDPQTIEVEEGAISWCFSGTKTFPILENDKNINNYPIYQYLAAEIWIHNLLISSEPFLGRNSWQFWKCDLETYVTWCNITLTPHMATHVIAAWGFLLLLSRTVSCRNQNMTAFLKHKETRFAKCCWFPFHFH